MKDLADIALGVLTSTAELVHDLQQQLRTVEKKLATWHFHYNLSNRPEPLPRLGSLRWQGA